MSPFLALDASARFSSVDFFALSDDGAFGFVLVGFCDFFSCAIFFFGDCKYK